MSKHASCFLSLVVAIVYVIFVGALMYALNPTLGNLFDGPLLPPNVDILWVGGVWAVTNIIFFLIGSYSSLLIPTFIKRALFIATNGLYSGIVAFYVSPFVVGWIDAFMYQTSEFHTYLSSGLGLLIQQYMVPVLSVFFITIISAFACSYFKDKSQNKLEVVTRC